VGGWGCQHSSLWADKKGMVVRNGRDVNKKQGWHSRRGKGTGSLTKKRICPYIIMRIAHE
jgi:hypothetical protein